MRSFIALFALAAIATVANGAAVAAEKNVAAEASVAAADPAAAANPAAAEAAVATPEDREAGKCPDGFIPLAECGLKTTATCVRVGRPIKYVSWFHLQYQCDSVGGYLPEITETTKAPLYLLHRSYQQLFGATTLYLGATDITHDGSWKWLSSGTEVAEVKSADNPQPKLNSDCLAQSMDPDVGPSAGAINCEMNHFPIQIANICFAKAATS